MSEYIRIATDELQRFVSAVFIRHGFTVDDANFVTTTLLDADRRGIASHGVQRLAMYDHKLRHGMINPTSHMTVLKDVKACALVDGHSGMGQIISRDAMNLAISKAHDHGIGLVTVRDSNHFGTAGFYARIAADQGLIGIANTNSNPLIVPTHAQQAALGSNPVAFAVGKAEDQFVYDAATSTVSLGKIEVLTKLEEPIDGDWAVDASGQIEHSSSNVMDGLHLTPHVGGLTPLGGVGEKNSGYKGYGLSVIVEILTGVLSSGLLSLDMQGQHICHCFCAISPEAFGGEDAVRERVAELLHRLRAMASADGHRVLVPGDKERAAFTRNRDSVPVDATTFEQLVAIGARTGVPFPGAGKK